LASLTDDCKRAFGGASGLLTMPLLDDRCSQPKINAIIRRYWHVAESPQYVDIAVPLDPIVAAD
jgi:hypothetical protein